MKGSKKRNGRYLELAAACLMAVISTGCGKKADLYLPEESPVTGSAPAGQSAPAADAANSEPVSDNAIDSTKEQPLKKQPAPTE